jgi:hypothetical protein
MFHGRCASDSVLGFRGHRHPTARWCWWLVPARPLAANSVAGRGALFGTPQPAPRLTSRDEPFPPWKRRRSVLS